MSLGGQGFQRPQWIEWFRLRVIARIVEDGGEAIAEDFLPLAEVVDVFAGGPILEGGAFAEGAEAAFDVHEQILAGGAVDDEVEGFEFGAGEEGFFGFVDGDVGEAVFSQVVFKGGFVVQGWFAARSHDGASHRWPFTGERVPADQPCNPL